MKSDESLQPQPDHAPLSFDIQIYFLLFSVTLSRAALEVNNTFEKSVTIQGHFPFLELMNMNSINNS